MSGTKQFTYNETNIRHFFQFSNDWYSSACTAGPSDRQRAETAVASLYKHLGLKRPAIVWCNSPLGAASVCILFKAVYEKDKETIDTLIDFIFDYLLRPVYFMLKPIIEYFNPIQVCHHDWNYQPASFVNIWCLFAHEMKEEVIRIFTDTVTTVRKRRKRIDTREVLSVVESTFPNHCFDYMRLNQIRVHYDRFFRPSGWEDIWQKKIQPKLNISRKRLIRYLRKSITKTFHCRVGIDWVENLLDDEFIRSLRVLVYDRLDNSIITNLRNNLFKRMNVGELLDWPGRTQMTGLLPVCVFFMEFFNVRLHPIIRDLAEIEKNAGWFFPHRSICWISERPNVLQRDDRNRLHSETGPALAYPDGCALYSYHGILVEENVITNPESITLESIHRETNAERKHVKIIRYGYERYLRDTHSILLHEDEYGKLWNPEMQRVYRGDPIVILEVENSTPDADGTKKKYMIRVPPQMKTAKEAVAWTFERTKENYAPELES